MQESKKSVLRFISMLFVLGIAIFMMHSLDLMRFLRVDAIRAYVQQAGIYAPLIFIGAFSIAIVFFVPATPWLFAGGVIFGPIRGLPYILAGMLIGAILSFGIARFLGESFVAQFLQKRFTKIHAWNERLDRNGFLFVLVLRLMPVFPFNILNIGFALTRVRFTHFVLATAIGIIPSSFVFTFLGSSFFEMNLLHIGLAIFFWVLLLGFTYVYSRKLRFFVVTEDVSNTVFENENKS